MIFSLDSVMDELKKERKIFHSEADFQFSLAWKIKEIYPTCSIRLEYCLSLEKKIYIDVVVKYNDKVYPIELKYKSKKVLVLDNGEQFNLKNHGAQDLGKYDFVKDIKRIEDFSLVFPDFDKGFVIWLTNDKNYWQAPKTTNHFYSQFSVHDGNVKRGNLMWIGNPGLGTIKGRESGIDLKGEYRIVWKPYSSFDVNKTEFKYSLIEVRKLKENRNYGYDVIEEGANDNYQLGRYSNLYSYLNNCTLESCKLKFSDIETIVSHPLPSSARNYRAWWGNGGHSHAKCWLSCGYKVSDVNLLEEYVIFVKK